MNLLEDGKLPRLNVERVYEVALVFGDDKEAFKCDELSLVVVPLDLADMAVLMTVDAGVTVDTMTSHHEVFAISRLVLHVALVSVGTSVCSSVLNIEVLAVAIEAFSLMFVDLVTSFSLFRRRLDYSWTLLEAMVVVEVVAGPKEVVKRPSLLLIYLDGFGHAFQFVNFQVQLIKLL